jgi:hypothetical protein
VNYGQMLAVPMPRSGRVFADQSEERAELALDLGLVNHAELMAYDALDAALTPGRAYELLALVYIAKDNRRVALNFLNVLEKTLVHREWAEHYRSLLDSGAPLTTDVRIREIRENMVRTDRPEDAGILIPLVSEGWDWEPILNRLLEVNPRNRMAFEYLMSLYLLTDRPGMVAENLARMRSQGYTRMPVLYQEALLTAGFLHGQVLGPAERSFIDPALARTYRSLTDLFEEKSRDPAATLRAVQQDYGSFYFAYSMWCKANAKAE